MPLLKYIYFTFLESEKISDEFNKYITDFIDYIRFEIARIDSSKYFSDKYYEYLNEFFFILCAYNKAFTNSNSAHIKSDSNQKENEIQIINKELNNLMKSVLSKQMIFLK